ncbi:MAG: ankyrin repeat domain-containing protein [Acidobacteriota bacterium]
MQSLKRGGVVSALVLWAVLAFAQGSGQLIEAAKKGDAGATKSAIVAGANVNEKGDAGLTPLMWAALHGHAPVIELLLSSGATINDNDSEGGTALAYARLAGHEDAIRILETRGGNLGKFQGDSFDSRLNLVMWTGSRRKDIFDYVTARTNERAAKVEAALQANWSAALDSPADFRGRWEFDAAQSDYGRAPKPKTVNFTITQAANEFVTDITLDGRRQVSTYKLDGAESVNVMASNARTLAKARWDGAKLVVSSTLEFDQIERAALEEVWSLSPDRSVLTIERHVTKPTESRLRQVMRRTRAPSGAR